MLHRVATEIYAPVTTFSRSNACFNTLQQRSDASGAVCACARAAVRERPRALAVGPVAAGRKYTFG